MIGSFLGLLVGFAYISVSWDGPFSKDSVFDSLYWTNFLWLAGLLVVGIFLFPRTIGLMFTPVIFILPVAFFISLFRHGFLFAISQALLGIAGWLVTISISRFRPEST
jgi:uncharacterized membrane protein YiaA